MGADLSLEERQRRRRYLHEELFRIGAEANYLEVIQADFCIKT